MMGENDHVPTSDAMSDMTSVLLTSKYSTSWWATSSASAIDEQETRETEKEASLFAGSPQMPQHRRETGAKSEV